MVAYSEVIIGPDLPETALGAVGKSLSPLNGLLGHAVNSR